MPHDVTMPQLGMAQDAGRIVAWLKKPGERVAQGDALFEVETDKATMEVEAQAAGFLTEVRAAEGEDVPVGRVIARISETAEGPQAASAPAPAADALPAGRPVTMPQLGMAQDTGVVVAWHVSPGDRVSEGDVLFEVETDKTTMEVPATEAGYVAALLAGEGEEVPVGEAVAILTDAPPAAPVRRSRGAAGAAQPMAPPQAAPPPSPPSSPSAVTAEAPVPAARPAPPVAPAPQANGRILASPKARKLALDRGIDLAALVAAGVTQPFHVRDVEAFRAPAAAPASHRITAEALLDGFTPFAAWAAETAGTDATAILAGFAAASFRTATSETRPISVAVEGQGPARLYLDPDRALGRAAPSPDAPPPALVLRDLRRSRITSLDTGPGASPVMTLGGRGAAFTVTLVWGEGQLAPDVALALADGFAARLEEPLRHLL